MLVDGRMMYSCEYRRDDTQQCLHELGYLSRSHMQAPSSLPPPPPLSHLLSNNESKQERQAMILLYLDIIINSRVRPGEKGGDGCLWGAE